MVPIKFDIWCTIPQLSLCMRVVINSAQVLKPSCPIIPHFASLNLMQAAPILFMRTSIGYAYMSDIPQIVFRSMGGPETLEINAPLRRTTHVAEPDQARVRYPQLHWIIQCKTSCTGSLASGYPMQGSAGLKSPLRNTMQRIQALSWR